MTWTPPADGIGVPAWEREPTTNAGDVRVNPYHHRPRHRQEQLSGPRHRSERQADAEEEAEAGQGARVLRQPTGLSDRYGDVRRRALLGPRIDQARPRGAAHAAAI